jgi:hypothetical protein
VIRIIHALLAIIGFAGGLEVPAQQLEPRSYSNIPVGMNFAISAYGYTEGSITTDAASPLKDAEVQAHNAIFGYARSFALWGMSGKFDIVDAEVWISGQALTEEVAFDPQSAQLLSASFLDYALPRADTLPSFATRLMEVPASSHPLGIRPGGEGGTTPALGLVVNAIVDALRDYGVTDVAMPATPQRVWEAIREAGLVGSVNAKQAP